MVPLFFISALRVAQWPFQCAAQRHFHQRANGRQQRPENGSGAEGYSDTPDALGGAHKRKEWL